MLIEIKNQNRHFFKDEQDQKQGEYKSWWSHDYRSVHCFYLNDKKHGEYKYWNYSGQLAIHCFYVDGDPVRFSEIPYPKTNKELMLFKLKYDLSLISDTFVADVIIAASQTAKVD